MNAVEKTFEQWRGSRLGGRVERGHAFPHTGSYSNAMHQWGVSMLMWYLWPEHFHRLVIYCLTHDLPEAWTGDIPAITLRYCPEVRRAITPLETLLSAAVGVPSEHDLSDDDLGMLKACDRLELYAWCLEQRELGSRSIDQVILELDYFFEKTPLPTRAMEFLSEMKRDRPIVRGGKILEKLT